MARVIKRPDPRPAQEKTPERVEELRRRVEAIVRSKGAGAAYEAVFTATELLSLLSAFDTATTERDEAQKVSLAVREGWSGLRDCVTTVGLLDFDEALKRGYAEAERLISRLTRERDEARAAEGVAYQSRNDAQARANDAGAALARLREVARYDTYAPEEILIAYGMTAAKTTEMRAEVERAGEELRRLRSALSTVPDAVEPDSVKARDEGRAEGLREAARIIDAKGDLLRKMRGGVSKACHELTLTASDLATLADKIVARKATISPDRDAARQAMQILLTSAENIRKWVSRERSIGVRVADEVDCIDRNITRLDAAIARIEANKGR